MARECGSTPSVIMVVWAVFLFWSLTVGPLYAAKPVKVVASFSILGDMAKNVGGDRIEVITLVGPDGDVHVFEPTPADAKTVSTANLVIFNGLGLEGWVERLAQTSGYKGPIVQVSQGIKLRTMEAGGPGAGPSGKETDPHAWQDLSNGCIYVENIARALATVDPGGAADYQARAAAYNARLAELDKWAKTELATIPQAKRRMITSHDALGYLSAAYGITILAPMGVSTASDPSAGGVAAIIKQIRQEKTTAVFIENVSDPRLIERIAKESGVKPGGELYSDALSKPDGPAGTYVDMFKHNITKILRAMRADTP